jgi:hypothetical protein
VAAAPQPVAETLLEFYGMTSGLWYASESSSFVTMPLARQAQAHLAQGDATRRAMALLLLCRADRAAGLKEARQLSADAAAPAELRLAASELLLGSGDADAALAALSEKDERLRQAAARAIVRRFTPFRPVPDVTIGGQQVMAGFLTTNSQPELMTSMVMTSSGVAAWQPPKLPAALSDDLLRGLAASQDSDLALGGAYLLALKGNASGLSALLDAWRQSPTDYTLADALPKAIAALGDDANVKYVKAIYASFSPDERRFRAPDLYTSIRRMDGPEAQALRKQMRQDLGPDLFR